MAGSSGWSYSAVSVTFWNSLTVRGWTEDGRTLALYLLTCPNRANEGFYHLPLGLVPDDLMWDHERTRAALAELMASDFVDIDEKARVVLIVKALKYTKQISGPPSLKGALNKLDKVNGSPRLFARFLDGAEKYQPDLAHAIRSHYSLPEGPYEGPT